MNMLDVAMLLAAAQQSASGFETVAWVVGVIVAIGALFGALAAIFSSIRRTWKWFWHTLIPWIKRAISLVNTLTDLPGTLTAMNKTVADHIALADQKDALLASVNERQGTIERQMTALVTLASDVRYELKNNGGGSTKDAVDRVEAGVAGIYDHLGVEPDNGMDLHQHETEPQEGTYD